VTPLPAVRTQLDLTPEQRIMAYTVIDQLDAFLSKERWLKGGWFKTDGDGPQRGFHTECLANFIRRVELAGPRLNGDSDVNLGGYDSETGEPTQNYAEARSVTEGVVAQAIRDLYPGEVRHMHFNKDKLQTAHGQSYDYLAWAHEVPESHHPSDYPVLKVDPDRCTLDHGGPCGTCKAERYSDEVTVQIKYGPFNGSEDPGEIIPSFNDTLGTRYADVQRVIDRSREMISGVKVTSAADVLDEQERMEMELASIDAQADIDAERIRKWFEGLESNGWIKRTWTKREAERRVKRILMRAEKDKEVVRQDCVNCA
jgi:hypothetical protein